MDKRLTVVVPAAGSGRRMGGELAKQYLPLAGQPILVHTLRRLAAEASVNNIVLVVAENEIEWCRQELIERYQLAKVSHIVGGGRERQDSVYQGLLAVSPETRWVAVHDAARPLLPSGLLERLIEQLEFSPAAIAAVPVADTIKRASSDGLVEETLSRERLWSVQTPQVFDLEPLLAAHRRARQEAFYATDDAALMERCGHPVQIVPGSPDNFKITTPEDLQRAEKHLRERNREMRIGCGYDVHRLAAGRQLILGGVEIPFPMGLDGHSDADVLVHAVMDAILGAAGARDIGCHFPDSDARYAGASSLGLLAQVQELIRRQGWQVHNLDCTIVAEKPRLAPYIATMQQNLAQVLNRPIGFINIKATTTEGLGFTGRQEGIAAQAVVSISNQD